MEDYFTLTEVKAIQQYPFTIVFRHSFGLKFSLDTWIDKLNKVLKQNRESNSHITEANIDLSEREWKVLQTAAEEKTFSKNQVILQQNKPFQGLYRVKSGAVRIEQQAPEETKILGILSVNQIFGEMSFFNRETTASIVAESSEVAVYHFSASVLISILSSSPELCLRFFKMICSVISFRLHNLPVLAAISKINDDDVKRKSKFVKFLLIEQM